MGEPDVSNLMTVRQAMAIIDAAAVRPRIVRTKLAECVGLFLAEDLRSDRDAPPFDKSLMDGYAVRAADVQTIPCELAVVGTVAAGGAAVSVLQPGQAMSIMTGAPLPGGADAVVPIEATQNVAGSNRVMIREAVAGGRFIARRGSDAMGGSIVVKTGTRVGSAQIAVAASVGAVNVPVFSRLRWRFWGRGMSWLPPDQAPIGSQIRSCNNAMLFALLGRFPCRAIDLGIVARRSGDDRRENQSGIVARRAAGDRRDEHGGAGFVPGILRRLGGDLKITKLRIKPGKPFVFAEMPGGKFVFGLPGNPVSAFVCTICLVSRLVTRMAGGPAGEKVGVARFRRRLKRMGRGRFISRRFSMARSLLPLKWKGSADIFTLSRANCLLVRPENQPAQGVGAAMEFVEI